MVEELDSEDLSRFAQALGHSFVFDGRCRVATRMVVADDDRRGGDTNRRPKDLAWVHETRLQGPDADESRADDAVPRIEQQNVKLLAQGIAQEAVEVSRCVARRHELVANFRARSPDPPPDFDGREQACRKRGAEAADRLELGHFDLAEPGNAAAVAEHAPSSFCQWRAAHAVSDHERNEFVIAHRR